MDICQNDTWFQGIEVTNDNTLFDGGDDSEFSSFMVYCVSQKKESHCIHAKPISLVLTLVTLKSETGLGAVCRKQMTRLKSISPEDRWLNLQNIYTEIKCTLGNTWPLFTSSFYHHLQHKPLGTHVSNHQENNWPQEFRHQLGCTKSFKGNEKRREFPRVRSSDSGVGPWPLPAVLSCIQHLAAQSLFNDVQQKVLLLTPKIHPPPFSLNIHSQIFSKRTWLLAGKAVSDPLPVFLPQEKSHGWKSLSRLQT